MPLLEPGFTFLPKEDGSHLWVVLTQPVDDKEALVVCVNFTDAGNIPDSSCVLHPGDHPWISKKTRVFYGKARLWSSNRILGELKKGRLIENDPLRPEVLKKVLEGARKSRFLPRKFKRFFVENQ